MTLFEAMNYAAAGRTIVSNAGKQYTPAELTPIYCGQHYAVFTTGTTTECERKGAWNVV